MKSPKQTNQIPLSSMSAHAEDKTQRDRLPESAWEPYKPRERSWESRYETARRIRETIRGTITRKEQMSDD